ncbi:MAG: PAS domain S-box protein [Spirochaetota bacterium]
MHNKNSIYERYLTIFENTGAGTILIDEDTTIVMVNNRFAAMLGYSKEEVEGRRSWTEFIHPEDVEWMKAYHYLRRQNPDAAPKNYEFRIFTRNGDLKYIYLTIDMIPQTRLSVASLTDITSLVEARQALQKSEQRYRMLVETMNDGLLLQKADLTIEYVNKRFCEIIGYDINEIVGKKIEDFLNPDYKELFKLQMELRSKGIQDIYELAWQRKDGTVAYTIVSPRIILDTNNIFAGSFAVVTDITERKKWELAIKQSEELFAGVYDATPVALALVDISTGEIIKANKLFRSIANIPSGTVNVSLFELNLVKKKDIRKLYKQLLKFKKINDYELQLEYNGYEHTAILSAEIINIHNKSLVIVSLTDITEKRILERELLSISENERRSIGQDLHDDIIPHLIGIDVMLKAMVQTLQKREKISISELEDIRNLLSEAVVKVRQLSRGLSPGYFISDQGLLCLLEELCEITRNVYKIHCEYKQNGTILITDPGILTHVYYIVQEALHNAVKYSKAEHIVVSVKADSINVLISVSDNGEGFDMSIVSGMGLKIMKHRADTIGANLTISSVIGMGTEVILRLKNENKDCNV